MATATLPDLRAELRELMGSWEYAFAMGAGCTMEHGHDLRMEAIRQRARDLHARIQEHKTG